MLDGLKQVAACVAALVILQACGMSDMMPNIYEGMSRTEVEAVMGSPNGFQRAGDETALQYTNRLMTGWAWDRADYGFIFRNDRLVSWGTGEVRQNTPNTFVIYGVR